MIGHPLLILWQCYWIPRVLPTYMMHCFSGKSFKITLHLYRLIVWFPSKGKFHDPWKRALKCLKQKHLIGSAWDWFVHLHGGFLKWRYPQTIHFNKVFHYKPSILRWPYFWKHPYGFLKILVFMLGKYKYKSLGSNGIFLLRENLSNW